MFLGFRPRDLNNEVCFIVIKEPTVSISTSVRRDFRTTSHISQFVWVRSIMKVTNLGPQYLLVRICTSVWKFSWNFLTLSSSHWLRTV